MRARTSIVCMKCYKGFLLLAPCVTVTTCPTATFRYRSRTYRYTIYSSILLGRSYTLLIYSSIHGNGSICESFASCCIKWLIYCLTCVELYASSCRTCMQSMNCREAYVEHLTRSRLKIIDHVRKLYALNVLGCTCM